MSLMDIKKHMMQVRLATLANLCTLFNTDADTLRCMLQHWVRKGKIRQCMRTSACGTRCLKCPSASTEWYEWVDGTPGVAII